MSACLQQTTSFHHKRKDAF